MTTEYAELFGALAAPFEHKMKPAGGGRNVPYITARQAMNRLDDVVGPENWYDDFIQGAGGVVCCKLTIKLPNGYLLTKSDAGGNAGMSDAGDDGKSGYSDAFKRAAAKFGVGRYLYGDGTAEFAGGAPPPGGQTPAPRPASAPRPSPAAPAPQSHGRAPNDFGWPKHGGALYAWAKNLEGVYRVALIKAIDEWAKPRGLPRSYKEWAAEDVSEGALFGAKFISRQPGYDGCFNQYLPTIANLKDTLFGRATELFTRTGGDPKEDALGVLRLIADVSSTLDDFGGEVIHDLDACDNEGLIRATTRAIDSDLKAGDDVPF